MTGSGQFTRILGGAAAVALGLSLAACSSSAGPQPAPDRTDQSQPIVYDALPGDTAVWQIPKGEKVTPTSTSFTIEVTRMGCASGKTGTVLAPVVETDADRIVIVARAGPPPRGGQSCQSNDWVAATVTLSKPVGQRRLIDGECTIGKEARTAECMSSVRWDPKTSAAEPLS